MGRLWGLAKSIVSQLQPEAVLPAGAGAGGALRRLAMGGTGELREPHLPLSMTLQVDHLRFLSKSHSRPVAATIKTTMMLHGVDEAGSSLGVGTGADEKAF